MYILDQLDELQKKAYKDEKLKKELLKTRLSENPLEAFCRKCRELGYEIYEMDLVLAGETFYADETEYQWRRRKFSHAGGGR